MKGITQMSKDHEILNTDDIGITKRPKVATKKPAPERAAGIPVSGMYGLAILFVCISIAYANYMVFFGTSDLISQIMLIPSTIFVVIFLILKAVK